MGVGPFARWKQRDAARRCATRLRWALARRARRARCCCRSLLGQLDAAGRASACCSRSWIVAATVAMSSQRLRSAPQRGCAQARAQPRAWYGMLLAHLGVAVFIVGVTLVQGLRDRAGRAHGAGRHGRRRRLHVPLRRRRAKCAGPNYARGARRRRASRATARPVAHAASRRSASTTRQRHADDRGGDRHAASRAISTSRSASRSATAARGACASTSSRSSTGSGAAAC